MSTISRMYSHISRGNAVKNPGAIRIGILGAANIAPMALISSRYSSSRHPDAVIVAVAARNEAAARKYAEKHHIPKVHANYDQLLADPDIDAIYNPLPNSLHHEWTVKALRAGKHVLCEKPITSNQEEAQQLKKVAEETGKVLVEAFHYRYHPAAKRILEIAKSGEIGEVERVHVHLHIPSLFFKSNDIRFNFELAGGTTMDLGCYAVNFVRFITEEEPTEISSAKATLCKPEIDERMEASFDFHSGRTASIDVSLRAWFLSMTATIAGKQGSMEISGLPLFSMMHSIKVNTKEGSRTEKHYGNGESTYYFQLSDFVKLVKGEQPSYGTTIDDGIQNMKVIDAIYTKAGLSVRGNRPNCN